MVDTGDRRGGGRRPPPTEPPADDAPVPRRRTTAKKATEAISPGEEPATTAPTERRREPAKKAPAVGADSTRGTAATTQRRATAKKAATAGDGPSRGAAGGASPPQPPRSGTPDPPPPRESSPPTLPMPFEVERPPPPPPPDAPPPPPPPDPPPPPAPAWAPPGGWPPPAPDAPPPPPPGSGWAQPPGAPPPGEWRPPGGPPPPNWSPGGGPSWDAAAVPATDGLAVASLVVALVALVLFVFVIPAVVAVVLGLVALRRIKKNAPRKGRGLAIAGVVIGIVVALGGVAFDVGIGYFVSRTTSYRALEPGDCIKKPGNQTLLLRRQSCSGPHERQVFATFDVPEMSSALFPGSVRLRAMAERECVARFAAIATTVPNRADLGVFFLVPGQSSWQDDDNRRIVCLLGNRDGSPLTRRLPVAES